MVTNKYRAQILLEPEQREALEKIAEQEGVSISHLVREAVAEYLVTRTATARQQRELDALRGLEQIRRRAEQRYGGIYQGDLVAEIRAERERQNKQVWEKDDEQ